MDIVTIILLVAIVILIFTVSLSKPSSNNLPPGPRNLPVIGSLHRLGRLLHHDLLRLSDKHGPLIFLKLGAVPTIVASSAGLAKAFLKTHDLDCCNRPMMTATAKLTYGSDVAFTAYGTKWRELRKTCIIEFMRAKKVAMFRKIREEEIGRMIEGIGGGDLVDLKKVMASVTNDITCRSALGKRYFDVEASGEESRLHNMLEETQAMFGGFFFADYMPALGWLDVLTGMRKRLEKIFTDFDRFYERVIDEHMDSNKRGDRNAEDTMDALLRIWKESEGSMSKEDIKGVLMDIFLGGSDTSSMSVEWAMSELIKNSISMRKAQNEVRNLLKTKGRVDEDDLLHLPYLKCIVKETMRLHPPVPLLVQRETMRSFEIEKFLIPPKTRVIINVYAIGRDKNSWERPEEFMPERFLNSSIDLKGQDFELLPFGAGRRICPGMHIGLTVIEILLANLLYAFDWELPEGIKRDDLDMEEAVGIVVHRKNALCLVATKWNFM